MAPATALLAALLSGEPLLAHWTQTFMGSAARFIAQFFPLFLPGAVFGKLMEDSGSVSIIAEAMRKRLGERWAILAVVFAGSIVTYGGVSLFVAFFVLVPMAHALFRATNIPRRLMPASIVLGISTFTMTALPDTPAIQNAIPMPFFGATPFAAPGLGLIAAAIMLGSGLWRLRHAEARALRKGERYVGQDSVAGTTAGQKLDAAMPALEAVRDWVLTIEGGPLVSLAIATNVLAALTGSASGGLTIALDVLGATYVASASQHGIDVSLMHRVAVIGSGTLDILPHNGAVVSLLVLCGTTHRESYFDIAMTGILGPVLALVAVIGLGSIFGSF